MTEVESLRAALKSAKEETEHFRARHDLINKKFAEMNKSLSDLKEQAQIFRDDNATLRKENKTLQFDKESLESKYSELEAKYENLGLRYAARRVPSPTNPMAGPLPDRTKPTRKPSKKEHEPREQREERDRGRVREEKRDQDPADKVRLSQRFEAREPREARDTRRPPRRHVEPWGSGGQSASATPGSRNLNTTNVSTGRTRETVYAPNHTSPRTPRTGFPMSPISPISSAFHSSGSSATYENDDGYEDGNYNQYPLHR